MTPPDSERSIPPSLPPLLLRSCCDSGSSAVRLFFSSTGLSLFRCTGQSRCKSKFFTVPAPDKLCLCAVLMEKDEPDIRVAVAVPVEQRHGSIRLLRVLDRIRVAQVCKRRLFVVVIEKHRVFREYAQQKRNFLAVGRCEDAGIVDPAPCAPVRAGNVCRFRRLSGAAAP